MRSAPRHVALGGVIGAVMAFVPAAADQHASAVATITATVHAPVAIRGTNGGAQPTVQAAAPHAYSLRLIRGEADTAHGLRTIFIDFD